MYHFEKDGTYVDWLDITYGQLLNNVKNIFEPLKFHMCDIKFMLYRGEWNKANETGTSIMGGASDDLELYVSVTTPDVIKTNLAFKPQITMDDQSLIDGTMIRICPNNQFKLVTNKFLNLKTLAKKNYLHNTNLRFKVEISHTNINVLLGEMNMALLNKMLKIEKLLKAQQSKLIEHG